MNHIDCLLVKQLIYWNISYLNNEIDESISNMVANNNKHLKFGFSLKIIK